MARDGGEGGVARDAGEAGSSDQRQGAEKRETRESQSEAEHARSPSGPLLELGTNVHSAAGEEQLQCVATGVDG